MCAGARGACRGRLFGPAARGAVRVTAPLRATCLGCGCACDDIRVRVERDRIAATEHTCPLGVRWFGDGHASEGARLSGKAATIDIALEAAARRLAAAVRPRVVLG